MSETTTEFAPEQGMTKALVLSDYLRVFRKYFWLLAALSFGLAAIAYVWSKKQDKLYDATALVQVDQHGTLSLSSALGSLSDEYELKITTQIMALQSRDVVLDVVKKLDLANNKLFNPQAPRYTDLDNPATRDYLFGQLTGGLDVERVPKTELISVAFRSKSPTLSALVANAVVDAYMEENFKHRYEGSKEITGWLTKELDELRVRVQSEQGDLLALELKLGVFDEGGNSQTTVYQTELNQLLTNLIHVQTQRLIDEAQYQQLAEGDHGAYPDSSMPGSQVLNPLNVQLAQTESQRAAMASRYGPGYAPLQELDKQVAFLKKNIEDQRQKIITGANQDAQAQAKAESDLQGRIDALKANAKGMSPDAVHYAVLKAQYTADQTLYNGLLTLLSAGGIEAGLQAQEMNRLSQADIPTLPSRPRTALNTAAGFGAGLLIALLIIGIIVTVSDTVETVEQIEEVLSLPVLAAVPVHKLEPVQQAGILAPLATLSAPRSSAAEAYRILRTSINLMPHTNGGRVVGITSSGPGEGKSTTVLNMGVAFAQQGKKVLLVDADLRKPVLGERLRLPDAAAPGLSRYLSDPALSPEKCIQSINAVPGLDVLPVQELPPFPSELLAQGRLEALVAWARRQYDVVLIDTPPILLVTDALVVAPALDTIVLVTRVGQTQRRGLRRIREELARFADKHIAVVVNAVPQSQAYYGGYGRAHGYYGSGSSK